jgi:hypothetical protein
METAVSLYVIPVVRTGIGFATIGPPFARGLQEAQ